MTIREVESSDREALRAFFHAVPAQDAAFLKEDLTDDAVIDAWLTAGRVTRLIYVDEDDTITGVASLTPGLGRSDHVVELRVVVDSRRRRGGVGRKLAQQAILTAVRSGCRKLTVEVGATQDGTINLFRELGFTPEALHLNQVRADDGEFLDIVVLAHSIDDNLSSFSTLGQAAAQ
ncbi:MAG: GNAT family N-acetyltransferase [Nocardioides sp.]|uniref:GNAT family N-acetyltransferase n=1 Tax=Nocardioides sp. TaxID=35761 RepID=UPI0039E21482